MWFEKGLDTPVSDYADIQRFAVQLAQPGDTLVEVGSFVGESMAYMLDEVKASGKSLRVFAVDLWDIVEMCKDGDHSLDMRMNDTGLTSRAWLAKLGPRCMLAEFFTNLAHNGRDKLLTAALVGRSAEMAALFPNLSVRFCFLDAGHSYENLTADLHAWYPKVRPDGLFAGHDWFSGEQVRRAVTDFAREKGLQIALTSSSWVLVTPGSPMAAHVQAYSPPAAAQPVQPAAPLYTL